MQDPQSAAYTYIISQLKAGLTADDIAAQLRQAGWDDASIHNAFAQAQAQMTPTPPAQEPIANEQPQAQQSKSETIANTPVTSDASQSTAGQETEVTTSEPTPSDTATAEAGVQQKLPEPVTRGRMKTGWLLFKQSLGVLKHYPSLWRYLLMTILWVSVLYITSIVIAIVDMFNTQALFYVTTQFDGSNEVAATPLGVILGIIVVYATTFITYYYGVGLSSHVLGIFKGEVKNYTEHMSVARKKISAIALYTLIAVIVGYILRMIEQRFKFVGALVSRILGAVWSLATSFVLPVIADSNEGGGKAVSHSAQLFKKTWGETITSRITLGGLVVLIYFAIAMPVTIILGVGLTPVMGVFGVFVAMAIFILGIIALSALTSLATSILNVSLYYYAEHGIIPPTYSPELLASVFYNKKAK